MNTPARVVLIVGVILALGFALFPRWERRWRENPGLPHENGDTVRAFLLTGPPVPPPGPLRYGPNPTSFSADVKWGETLGVFLLMAGTGAGIAYALNGRRRE